jgi:drug/metabolite transporter (DMT)-like permease
MVLFYQLLITLACILIATAQIVFKKSLPKFELNLSSVIYVLLLPKIIFGMLLYFLALLIYLYALSNLQLSVAYPFLSFSFIFVTIFSVLFLKEKITFRRMVGILFIIIGVILVSI